MKKGLISSYIDGITDISKGESYTSILKYFWPEFISALVLYSVLYLLDEKFIAELRSTTLYATLGVTNTLLHFIVKVAEGMSIGTVIICGQFNGAKDYRNVGKSFVETFWVVVISGACLSAMLYFGAYHIYAFYGVPERMIHLGVPFLRTRAIGVFFMFLYFALMAFLRGIKNTRTPMQIFVLGSVAFIFFDYVLIFGKFGFPALGFLGSAIATVIQYGVMLVVAFLVVLLDPKYKEYGIKLLAPIKDFALLKRFFYLSMPVVLDKATMATAYIWLGKMIAPMGKCAIASFTVIKSMERFAFLPAIAFAQVITLLASNDFGAGNISGIKNNIKKTMFMSSVLVAVILTFFSCRPEYFIQIFDLKGVFTDFAARAFPLLSAFVLFDVFQIVLSGALRGASDVKVVMWTRLLVISFCFVPISYFVSQLQIEDPVMKFSLIYGTFYVSNGIMSMVYINRFRSGKWKDSKKLRT